MNSAAQAGLEARDMARVGWRDPVRRRDPSAPPPPAWRRGRRSLEGPPTVAEVVREMADRRYDGATRTNCLAYLEGGRFTSWLAEEGIATIDQLAPSDLERFLGDVRDHVSPATRNKYAQYLNRLREHCERTPGRALRADGVAVRPLGLVRERQANADVRVIGAEEMGRLQLAARDDPRDETLLLWMLDGGPRPGEAIGVTLDQAHLTRELCESAGCMLPAPHMHITRSGPRRSATKTWEVRAAPLSTRAARRLLRWINKERGDCGHLMEIFPSRRRDDGRVVPMTVGSLQDVFVRLSLQAGIAPHLVPYVTRHTWATALANRGMPERQLMQLGGWRDTRSLHSYYRRDQRAAIEAYNDLFAGEP